MRECLTLRLLAQALMIALTYIHQLLVLGYFVELMPLFSVLFRLSIKDSFLVASTGFPNIDYPFFVLCSMNWGHLFYASVATNL